MVYPIQAGYSEKRFSPYNYKQ